MTYKEAECLFLERCGQENLLFPYGKKYEIEEFLLVEMPLELLRQRGIAPIYSDLMSTKEMDPVWIKACKKKGAVDQPYWDRLFSVVDGNHRVASAVRLGRTHIKAIMPESHYKFWRSLNGQDS